MRDIVATIAAEQDEVIRAPLATCLVVQGGPGTGKTAVGLHRAAFLLYEHRRELDAAGVLVVGPNPIFLRYIAQVLPSLGETAVRQTTLERLLSGTAYRRRGGDGDDTARLKGDARMAAVLARAVTASVQPPDTRLEAVTPWGRIRLDAEAVFEAVADVHDRGVPHNVGRAALRTRLVRLARQDLVARRGEELASLEAVDASLRADRGWQRALDRIWPALNPASLVRRLLTNRNALRSGQRRRARRRRAGVVAPPADQAGVRRAVDGRRPGAARRGRGAAGRSRRRRTATWSSTRHRTCRAWGSVPGAAVPPDR